MRVQAKYGSAHFSSLTVSLNGFVNPTLSDRAGPACIVLACAINNSVYTVCQDDFLHGSDCTCCLSLLPRTVVTFFCESSMNTLICLAL